MPKSIIFLVFLAVLSIYFSAEAGWVEQRWTDSSGVNHQGTVSPPTTTSPSYSPSQNNYVAPVDPAETLRKANLNLAHTENKKCVESSKSGSTDSYRNALPYCQNAASLCKRNSGGKTCDTYQLNLHHIQAWVHFKDGNLGEAINALKSGIPYCSTKKSCDSLNASLARVKSEANHKKLKRVNENNLSEAQDKIDRLAKTKKSSTSFEFIDPREQANKQRKTNMLLDALAAGNKNWGSSVNYLEEKLKKNPEDRATRDALVYVKGLHEGHIMMSEMNDVYYKKGVNAWMGGDYGGAANDFATAYQAHPDDKGALQAFAFVSGIHDGTEATRWAECSMINTCNKEVSPPSAGYGLKSSISTLLNTEQKKHLDDLRKEVTRNPNNLKQRATLNFVEGLSAWDDYKGRKDDAAQKALSASLKKINNKEYKGAISNLAKEHTKDPNNAALIYAYYHARGLDEGTRYEDGKTEKPQPVWDKRMSKVYLELLSEEVTTLPEKGDMPWSAADRKIDKLQEKAWYKMFEDPFKKGSEALD